MTTKLAELNAELRSVKGKGASRRLRRTDKVPGVIYGAGQDAVSLMFINRELKKAMEQEAFYSQILTVNIDGKKEKAVLKAVQRHPYKAEVLHLDLMRISAKEKINMQIPLHFIGEEEAPGVKEGGIVSHHMINVEVSCLPANLPEYIEVDISHLAIDQAVHLSELKIPKDVTIVVLAHDPEHDHPVVSIHEPKVIIEEEEKPAEEAEGEAAEGEAKAEGEGEAKAEGKGEGKGGEATKPEEGK